MSVAILYTYGERWYAPWHILTIWSYAGREVKEAEDRGLYR